MADSVWEQIVEKIAASRSLLLSIMGILLLALGLAGGIAYHDWFAIRELPARIIAGVAGLVIFVFGVATWRSETKQPIPADFDIKIRYPQEGDRVAVTDVSGTIKKPLPSGYSLVVFKIFPNSKTFAPIGEAWLDGSGVTWRAESCNIGGNSGDRRTIGIYLVGPDAKVLLEYFNKAGERHKVTLRALKNATGSDGEYLPSLSTGTADLIRCHTIGVIRS